MSNYTFQGWLGLDKTSVEGKMQWSAYAPKTFDTHDIDIKITHCGVCGSDLHTLRSGWMPSSYPVCVGHEIVGHVVRKGDSVSHLEIGDRVGVGAQSGACLNQKGDCELCADGLEQHCPRSVNTYNAKWPDGSKTYGGYADYWRGDGRFAVKIPAGMASDIAAPMMCGGITAFSPLTQHGAGPDKTVGIIGLGGLGHFGVLGAKALGCKKIIAISRTSAKKEDALKMGATDFIATDESKDWHKQFRNSLDIIICTVSSPQMPLQRYLSLLRFQGTFVQVGAPEDPLPAINAFALIGKRVRLTGSGIGSRKEIQEMLDLFAKTGVKTWNHNVSMKDANQVLLDFEAGKARYRYVLVNEKHVNEAREAKL